MWVGGANTVSKWRIRFAKMPMAGLCDAPRAGQPRTVTDDKAAEVVVTTMDQTPDNATPLVCAVDGEKDGHDPVRFIGSGGRSG